MGVPSRLKGPAVVALAALLAVSPYSASPAAATIYNPPWADAMWAHFPGTGGLDTTTSMNYVRDGANALGYHGFSTNPSSVPASMGGSYAQSDAIWWMAGHGAAGIIQSYNSTIGWGSLYVSNNAPGFSSCSSPNDCLTDYTSTQMHRIRLMVFQGCDTADPTPNGDRLNKRAFNNLGVDSSIGFTETIYFGSWPDHWADYFMFYSATKDVVDSAGAAADVIYSGSGGNDYGYYSYYIYGGSVRINPPAYGG